MIHSVHILRGLCAWMVVVHHFSFSYFQGMQNPLPSALQEFTFILGIGVDVFFVISGFVMSLVLEKNSLSAISSFSFLKKRLLRIIPGWWFYLTLFILTTSFLSKMPYPIEWEWKTALQSIILIPHQNLNGSGYYPILYVGWSLMYELFFYGLIFALLAVPIKHIGAIVGLTLFVITIIFPESSLLGHSNFFFMEFLVGFIFRKSPVFVGAFILWSGFSIFQLYGIFEAARFALATSIFTIFLSYNITENSLIYRIMKSSGDYSYSLYLSHLIIIGLVHIAFPPSNNMLMNTLALITVILLTYYISKLSFKWVEQKFHQTK